MSSSSAPTALLRAHFDSAFDSPEGIKKLRELILSLAMRGQLVLQDPKDEPASELLKKIEAEKRRLVVEGKIKEPKALPEIKPEEVPYQLPAGWEWVRLGNSIECLDAGWSPKCEEERAVDNEWGILKTTAVQPLKYMQLENKKLPRNLEPKIECEVHSGDILITRAGPRNRVGICCFVESTRPRLMLSDKIIRFSIFGEMIYGYFCALSLNTGIGSEQLEKAKSGMADSQVNISQEKLKLINIPLPPLAEQQRIVAKVDELMKLCDELEAKRVAREVARTSFHGASLAALLQAQDSSSLAASWASLAKNFGELYTTKEKVAELRKAILQLAVMGRLVKQDPKDQPASELLKEIDEEKWRLVKEEKIKQPKVLTEIKPAELPFKLPMGWEWARVDRIGEVKLGRQRSPDNHHGKDMMPYLRVANVYEARIDISSINFMNFTQAEQEVFRLMKNDILLNEGQSYALVGRPAIYNDEVPGACFQNTLIRLRPYSSTMPNFILLVFRSYLHSGRFQKEAQQTTNIAHLSASRLSNIEFPLPPLAEQQRIVAKVDELMKLSDDLERGIETAEGKREGLLGAVMAAVE